MAALGGPGSSSSGDSDWLLASGTAWGEWGAAELKNLGLNFIPQGIRKVCRLVAGSPCRITVSPEWEQ